MVGIMEEKRDTENNKLEENDTVLPEDQDIKATGSSLEDGPTITRDFDNNKNCGSTNGDAEKMSEFQIGSDHNYELVDNIYYYTDTTTGIRYKFNDVCQTWESVSESTKAESGTVTTDEEGRQYYTADGMELCRDSLGNVFYLDKNNEWKPWSEASHLTEENGQESELSRWYFYKGSDVFYRDKSTNVIYKLKKETNAWEVYERNNKKRRKGNSDEEFDTDDDEENITDDDDDAETDGTKPPGSQSDPTISYDGKIYTKHDPSDNTHYEWDPSKRAWFPKIDEDFMASYQLSYGFNPDGTKNENPVKYDDDDDDDDAEEEAKQVIVEDENKKSKDGKSEKKKPSWFEIDDAHNTKVYVSNLPTSMTEEEFIDFMGKCGLILKDLETQKHKVKLYKDEEGNFKGDALCTYIKRESVELALQILDDYRFGSNTVKVEIAKFTQKGEYNPSLKPKKKRKKELEKLQKKQEKLFDWRPEPMRGQRMKHENVVIMRNVFNPKEFETAAEMILTHKEAIRSQAESFGQVKKVELFDRHPEGVMKITFTDIVAADLCVVTLNKRLYLKRTLFVSTWDGAEKFNIEETEEERALRIRRWEEFLEGNEKNRN